MVEKNHLTKPKNILIVCLFIVVLTIGFTVFSNYEGEVNSTAPKNVLKNVTVQKVSEESYTTCLDYLGIVKPYETKNYAFLQGGKIEKIYVKKGQKINAGDILAKLETTALELSKSTAVQNVKSLENSIRFSKSHLEATKSLFEAGAVAPQDFEAEQTEYQNLLATYEIAKNSLSQAEEGIDNATLYADREGYVMELPFKEGEIAGAGYPVVISKSESVMVTAGVSVDDYAKISSQSAVLINNSIAGTIDSISAFPDEETRVYAVDIRFNSDDIAIGETVDVQIATGQGEGCFIPMESVFNLDGIDYVYTVSGNKVNKQQVTIHEISGSSIRITGLKSEALVVTAGIKSLKENDAVTIVEKEGAVD
ncbi:MAG: efflux RND transporter periplasmic adaptor subunit [Syntrophomonadaceae bacterium]|nr:efflux RND transporter periplasmic adaptor subunit [Syntrophomonadaceae bacterium]